jgi:hypothetical protein
MFESMCRAGWLDRESAAAATAAEIVCRQPHMTPAEVFGFSFVRQRQLPVFRHFSGLFGTGFSTLFAISIAANMRRCDKHYCKLTI